jgi:CRISPR-associated protein Cas1
LYALRTVEIVGALDAVGLDPQIGYLHRPRSGRPSLALDMLEEFRPAIDRFAAGLVTRRMVTVSDFERGPGGAVSLTDEGRRRLLSSYQQHQMEQTTHPLTNQCVARSALVHVQATLLARAIRSDFPTYPPWLVER